jgi:hypothetical protein
MTMTQPEQAATAEAYELPHLAVTLLKGVLYRADNPTLWQTLLNLQTSVRDYFSVLGLSLVLDEAEGYAFLRSREDDNSNGEKLPRLIPRRQLSFPVSLLLALLRRKLAEFDAGGGETRLVLRRDEIVELMRVFLPDSTNDSRLVDQIETQINKVVELGFLRRLKPTGTSAGKLAPEFEVLRILKAFVDAQWLNEFDQRLAQYQSALQTPRGEIVDE